jgi:hypothetical protein
MSTIDPQGLGSPQGGELTEAELASCVRSAVSAPSIHNSQPWQFRYRVGGVDVIADQTRRLEVIDPSGRELLISVGAAIFNLRLAMRRLGRVPAVRLFPDPAEPDLVAIVTPGPAAPPTAALSSLADAMARRHTNRQPFARIAIPSAVLDELTEAARLEGAELRLADAVVRSAILSLVRTAEQRLSRQGRYRAELTDWTRPARGRPGEVPVRSFGPWDALETLPLRDFGLTLPQPVVRHCRSDAAIVIDHDRRPDRPDRRLDGTAVARPPAEPGDPARFGPAVRTIETALSRWREHRRFDPGGM